MSPGTMGCVTPPAALSPDEKLRVALELHDLGVAMMRENLRRRFPLDTHDQTELRLIEWLQIRPGAELGDAIGRSR